MIEVRKESNSKAIIVFTAVTVIFLPLSFVTSYLGMNSVDIRNGTFNQSLFWIIALPSTTCLLLSLWIIIRFRGRLRRLLVYLRRFWLHHLRRGLNGIMIGLSRSPSTSRTSLDTLL